MRMVWTTTGQGRFRAGDHRCRWCNNSWRGNCFHLVLLIISACGYKIGWDTISPGATTILVDVGAARRGYGGFFPETGLSFS